VPGPGLSEASSATTDDRNASSRTRAVLLRLVLLLLAGAALGAVCGVVWQWVWTPPAGAAWEKEWFLDPSGLPAEVGATGWFTVVGVVGGIVYGTVAGKACRRHELATLAGVTLGALLAAWVMYAVGHALGPADPHELAKEAGDWEQIPGDLRLAGAGLPWPLQEFRLGSSALLAPVVGALLGLAGILFGEAPRRVRARRGRDHGGEHAAGHDPEATLEHDEPTPEPGTPAPGTHPG